MALSTTAFTDIAQEILNELGDPNGNVWTIDEIVSYLDEGQLELAEQTEFLRGRKPISSRENLGVYNFPDDLLKPLRVEDKDGVEIVPTNAEFLRREFGGAFRNRDATGNARYYYSDFAGQRQLEFHPRPSPTIEKGSVNFAEYIMQDADISSTTTLTYYVAGNRLYVLTDNLIIVYDDDLRPIRKIAHGQTMSGNANYLAVGWKHTSSLYNTPGTIFFNNGAGIIKVDPNGVVSTFGTAAASINMMYEVEDQSSTNNGRYLYFSTGTNIYYTPTNSFSATSAANVTAFQSASNNGTVFFACSNSGIYRAAVQSPLSQLTSQSVQGIVNHNGTLYINHNGLLATITELGVITDKGIVLHSQTTLHSDGNYIWSLNGSSKVIKIDVSGSTPSISATFSFNNQGGKAVSGTPFPSKKTALFGGCFFSYFALDSINVTFFSNNELGDVCFCDSAVFDSEYGGLVDVVDDTDLVTIFGDLGGVEEIISSATVAMVNYVRQPQLGILEFPDARSLKAYAKFRAYDKRTDKESARLQAKNLAIYNSYMARLKSRVSAGFNSTKMGVSPHYY